MVSLIKNPPPTNAPVNVYSKCAFFYNKKSFVVFYHSPRSALEVMPVLVIECSARFYITFSSVWLLWWQFHGEQSAFSLSHSLFLFLCLCLSYSQLHGNQLLDSRKGKGFRCTSLLEKCGLPHSYIHLPPASARFPTVPTSDSGVEPSLQ